MFHCLLDGKQFKAAPVKSFYSRKCRLYFFCNGINISISKWSLCRFYTQVFTNTSIHFDQFPIYLFQGILPWLANNLDQAFCCRSSIAQNHLPSIKFVTTLLTQINFSHNEVQYPPVFYERYYLQRLRPVFLHTFNF